MWELSLILLKKVNCHHNYLKVSVNLCPYHVSYQIQDSIWLRQNLAPKTESKNIKKKQLLHFLETSCNRTNSSTIQTIYLFPPPKKGEKFPSQIDHIAICGQWLEVMIFLLISVQSWRLWTPSNSVWGGFGH